MGNLAFPLRSKLFERFGDNNVKVSVCTMQGYRSTMEDAHVVQLSLDNHKHSQTSLYGIFDGHNGPKAAEYISKNIVKALNNLENLNDNKKIQQTIIDLDVSFCESEYKDHGSTIVFALVTPKINHENKLEEIEKNLIKEKVEKEKKENENENEEEEEENIMIPLTQQNDSQNNHELLQNDINQNINKENELNHDKNMEYHVRVFWAGDTRAIWIKEDNNNNNNNNKEEERKKC